MSAATASPSSSWMSVASTAAPPSASRSAVALPMRLLRPGFRVGSPLSGPAEAQPSEAAGDSSGPRRTVGHVLDLPALDVAVGLIFLYVVLSLVCSTVNEIVATSVGLRARFLQMGILNLLSAAPRPTRAGVETAKAFYAHPLVQGLIRPAHGPDPSLDPTSTARWWRKPPYPSYIPSRTFVAALSDLLEDAEGRIAAADEEEAKAVEARLRGAAAELEQKLAAVPNARLSEALLSLYRAAGADAAAFKHATEEWFDDAMERVSGWYRRRIQVILAVIATLVVLLLNADTLASGRVLWRDDAVRASVVRQAETSAQAGRDAAEVDEAVQRLDLPLGWDLSFGDRPTQVPDDPLSWIAKLVGLGLTVGAVLLGAPFWFDLLSKIVRVRATGAPPPATDAVRAGEGDQKRAGPGAAAPAGARASPRR